MSRHASLPPLALCLVLLSHGLLLTAPVPLPGEKGDPYSDPLYLHEMCTRGMDFRHRTLDADGQPDDLTAKCYRHCLLGTIGVIDEHQRLHVDVLLPGVSPEQRREYDGRCGRLRGENICDTAYLMTKCLLLVQNDYDCRADTPKCSYLQHLLLLLHFHWTI